MPPLDETPGWADAATAIADEILAAAPERIGSLDSSWVDEEAVWTLRREVDWIRVRREEDLLPSLVPRVTEITLAGERPSGETVVFAQPRPGSRWIVVEVRRPFFPGLALG